MSRSVRKMRMAISPRFATSTFGEHGRILPHDELRRSVDRRARRLGPRSSSPSSRVSFPDHDYWATGVFCAAMATDWFDGRIARRSGRTSPLGSLLDPVADKLLVLATLIVLIDQHVFPAWMVAAIVARELLDLGLRQAALERGVVIAARDLGKLKTWAQAIAAGVGGPRRGRRLERPTSPGGRCSSPSS